MTTDKIVIEEPPSASQTPRIVVEDRGTFLVLVSSEKYPAVLSTTNSIENVQASHVLESLRQLGNELVWEDLQNISVN